MLGLQEITTDTLWLGAIAAAMIGVNLFVFHRLAAVAERPPASSFILGAGVLAAQIFFWGGVAYYLSTQTVDGFTLFGLAAQFMMVPFGLWFVAIVLRQSERPIRPHATGWAVCLALLLFGNEMIMSLAFLGLTPSLAASDGTLASQAFHAAIVPLTTLWYFWPMATTMIVFTLWAPLSRPDRRLLIALAASAFVAPWTFEQPVVGAIAMAVVMSAGIAMLVASLSRALPKGEGASLRLQAGVGSAFVAVAVSWLVASALEPASWNLAPFAVVMTTVMIVESAYLLLSMVRVERPEASGAGVPLTPAAEAGRGLPGSPRIPPDSIPGPDAAGSPTS